MFVLLAVRHANDTLRQQRDREGQSTDPSIPSNPSSSESRSRIQELIALISCFTSDLVRITAAPRRCIDIVYGASWTDDGEDARERPEILRDILRIPRAS